MSELTDRKHEHTVATDLACILYSVAAQLRPFGPTHHSILWPWYRLANALWNLLFQHLSSPIYVFTFQPLQH